MSPRSTAALLLPACAAEDDRDLEFRTTGDDPIACGGVPVPRCKAGFDLFKYSGAQFVTRLP